MVTTNSISFEDPVVVNVQYSLNKSYFSKFFKELKLVWRERKKVDRHSWAWKDGFVEFQAKDDIIEKIADIFKSDFDKIRREKLQTNTRNFGTSVKTIGRDSRLSDFEKLDELFEKLGALEHVSAALGADAKLRALNLHLNDPTDIPTWEKLTGHQDTDNLFWHHDNNVSTVKAMIYLTTVESSEDGSFSLLTDPNDHRLKGAPSFVDLASTRSLRSMGIHENNNENIEKRKRLFIKDPYSSNVISGERIKRILRNGYDKKEIVNPTNIVLFNPLYIHRGGVVKRGERRAVQCVFCASDAWRV